MLYIIKQAKEKTDFFLYNLLSYTLAKKESIAVGELVGWLYITTIIILLASDGVQQALNLRNGFDPFQFGKSSAFLRTYM